MKLQDGKMKLYLMRHGDANTNDPLRPLSQQGEEEVSTIAQFLASNGALIEQIYHSDKLRAEQTAKIIASHFDHNPKVDILPGLSPDDPVKPIGIYCNYWHHDSMLVGHLPFMPKLVTELLLEHQDVHCIDFKTASLLCLEKIGISQWSISWFVCPGILNRQ